jgi:hypothetical protein
MGLGLFQFQQGRPPDHAKLSVGAKAADVENIERFSDLTIGMNTLQHAKQITEQDDSLCYSLD